MDNVLNQINSMLDGHLEDYQIRKVDAAIRDFQDINKAAENIILISAQSAARLIL